MAVASGASYQWLSALDGAAQKMAIKTDEISVAALAQKAPAAKTIAGLAVIGVTARHGTRARPIGEISP